MPKWSQRLNSWPTGHEFRTVEGDVVPLVAFAFKPRGHTYDIAYSLAIPGVWEWDKITYCKKSIDRKASHFLSGLHTRGLRIHSPPSAAQPATDHPKGDMETPRYSLASHLIAKPLRAWRP